MNRAAAATHIGLLVACLSGASAMAAESSPPPECGLEYKVPARDYLARVTTGWRPLLRSRAGRMAEVDEVGNAEVIFDTFVRNGRSPALAFAAIVTAMSESSLDQTAVMDDPFVYEGKPYPNGSGAIGLFQLLPSQWGAGGPSGPEQGYSREFQFGRWAGDPTQARAYGHLPDELGRRYYDATDPRTNTERILLEIERDGAALLKADAEGASIADLTWLFGRDIERPQGSTRYRRQLAVEMLGEELALAPHPNDHFAPVVALVDHWEALAAEESAIDLPAAQLASKEPYDGLPRSVLGAFTLGFLSLVGVLKPL